MLYLNLWWNSFLFFKILQIIPYIYICRNGYLWLKENHEEEREKIMKSSKIYNVFSCPAEKIIGSMCMVAYLAQIIFKSQTNTLIFIFNPCHAVTFCYGLVYLLPFSIVTEVIACGALGGSFGACLGLMFPEN